MSGVKSADTLHGAYAGITGPNQEKPSCTGLCTVRDLCYRGWFFIGNSIGDIGLSTINVAYPVVALMQAIGTGIGMGGAVIYSISVAAGDKKGADTYARGTGSFLLLASIVVIAVMYIILEPVLGLNIPQAGSVFGRIVKVILAPFGLTLTPNLSVILMNRYTIFYGGEQAVACYACIAYAVTIIHMLLQGVGDGSQPLMSRFYGEGAKKDLCGVRRLAYGFAGSLAVVSVAILFSGRYHIGNLFGASKEVLVETGNVLPMFLVGIIFLSFTRVTTSGFYAAEKSLYSYILVYAEPVLLFILLLILPRFTGMAGVWWSTCLSQVFCAVAALLLKNKSER